MLKALLAQAKQGEIASITKGGKFHQAKPLGM